MKRRGRDFGGWGRCSALARSLARAFRIIRGNKRNSTIGPRKRGGSGGGGGGGRKRWGKKRGGKKSGGGSRREKLFLLSLSPLYPISLLSLFALISLSPPSPRSSLSRSLPPQSRADLEGEPCFLSLARRLRGRRVPGRCSAAAPPPLWRRAAEEGAPTGGGQEQIDADLRLP